MIGHMMFTPPVPTLCRDGDSVMILDQTALPHRTTRLRLHTTADVAHAIRAMQVRGAPLIGATAAFGVALALHEQHIAGASAYAANKALDDALERLAATRPTAVNLHWALARMAARLRPLPTAQRLAAAWAEAEAIRADDIATCAAIGHHGLNLLRSHAKHQTAGRPVRVMTHCNAGWLATLGAGTALAPVYAAHAADLTVHVIVSETRPRNQGLLTAWELRQAGVPYTLIADNAAGLLLARGEVDVVITGADRVAANGDTANKIGTYLKALAARTAGVPFYIAAPRSTLDFACANGSAIPIEERDGDEVRRLHGLNASGGLETLNLVPDDTHVNNPAFDVTPATLIDGFITEDGVLSPSRLRETASPHEHGTHTA